MANSYYSTVVHKTADEVWTHIRDFGHYEWGAGVSSSEIENEKYGTDIGAIRSFRYYDVPNRQRLLSHSDSERYQSWEGCEVFGSLRAYENTIRVTPIIEGNGAFVEWSAQFDAPAEEYDYWATFFLTSFRNRYGS